MTVDSIWHPDIPHEYRNQIVTGDARELAKRIPDESIDVIFTDPPYLQEFHYLYEWLSCIGRVLKPTGFLFTYCGGYWKPKVMAVLGSRLEYFWDYTLGMPGNNSMMWPRKTIARAKSILCYRPIGGNGLPRYNVLDLWIGSAQDKRFHTWGQEESAARYYIESFTALGDVVLDPLVGGGTISAVCRIIERNYIAFEIDPDTADLARDRVANTQPPLPLVMSEQLELI